MHDDVKRCFPGSKVHCGSCSHERLQYGVIFPEAGHLNGSNADMCLDVVGASSSGSGDLIDFGSHTFTVSTTTSTTAAILDLSVTTTPILPFGACYVITHELFCRA